MIKLYGITQSRAFRPLWLLEELGLDYEQIALDYRGKALEAADDGSLILIAGKGHETTQTVGDRVLAFSDHDVVRELAGRAVCG